MKLFWCMCHKPHLIFSSDKLPEIGKGNSGEIDLELFFYNLDFELRITYFDIMINYHLSQKSELMKRVILVFSRLTNIQKMSSSMTHNKRGSYIHVKHKNKRKYFISKSVWRKVPQSHYKMTITWFFFN